MSCAIIAYKIEKNNGGAIAFRTRVGVWVFESVIKSFIKELDNFVRGRE